MAARTVTGITQNRSPKSTVVAGRPGISRDGTEAATSSPAR